MKKFLFVLLILTLPITLLACSPEEKKTKKTINVGMHMDFVPFEFTENGEHNVKGFDVDVMKAIGNELGYEITFLDYSYDDLFDVLEKGNIDAVISAVSITDERKERMSFTEPYFESGLVVAVRADNSDIKGFTDLPGKRVAVAVGTTGAITVREQKSLDVLELRTAEDTFSALLAGKVDAVVNDKPMIYYYLNTHKDANIKVLPEIYQNEYYGIAVKKDNKELLDKLNDALKKIKEKGVYDKIYEKWFVDNGQ